MTSTIFDTNKAVICNGFVVRNLLTLEGKVYNEWEEHRSNAGFYASMIDLQLNNNYKDNEFYVKSVSFIIPEDFYFKEDLSGSVLKGKTINIELDTDDEGYFFVADVNLCTEHIEYDIENMPYVDKDKLKEWKMAADIVKMALDKYESGKHGLSDLEKKLLYGNRK